jgi:hypothetical protein
LSSASIPATRAPAKPARRSAIAETFVMSVQGMRTPLEKAALLSFPLNG